MMRRPRPKGDRISPRRHEVAFTFIAPRGFSHPKTRAHVRLLGPCFKTGRMDPYDRQRPKRVVREHRPNDRQQSRSTASSPLRSTTGRKDGTLATRGTRCDCPRSDPSRGSRAVTVRSRDSRPTFHGTSDAQFRPTLTRAQEKCDGGEARARDRGPFGSANPEPRTGRPAESRREHC